MKRIYPARIERLRVPALWQARSLIIGTLIGLSPFSAPLSQTESHHPDKASAGSSPAVQALSAGRRAKGEGRLAEAEARLQKALAAAQRDSPVFDAALEELTYFLPLMRVERHVTSQQWSEAEQLLKDLLAQHQSDEDKSRHLVHLISELHKRTPVQGGVYTQPGGGHQAIRRIEEILERFFKEQGRYPAGYPELNELLPADRFPLNDYDIVHYANRGAAYGLTLRSKSDPFNLLSVQKTGLVQ